VLGLQRKKRTGGIYKEIPKRSECVFSISKTWVFIEKKKIAVFSKNKLKNLKFFIYFIYFKLIFFNIFRLF
jgi:hypothetical protein